MDGEHDGYITSLPFEYAYRSECAPAHIQFAAFNRGVPFPTSRPLRYLELGYGTGISLNIHAAASPGAYWGVDVNPAHAATAHELAEISGSSLNVLQASFTDLLERPDLPQFDVIVALGVWSWVSVANRQTILQLLRRNLVEGGIFCMNSIAMPGFSELAPFQRLMRLNLKRGGAAGTIVDKFDSGLKLASALQDSGSEFFAPGSRAGRMLGRIRAVGRAGLVHEYLEEHWKPALFAETAAVLDEAGLRFVASTALVDQFDELNFRPDARALLASIGDPWLRETARDFLRSGHVKGDLYVKRNEPLPVGVPARPPLDRGFILDLPAALAKKQSVATWAARIDLGEPPFGSILDLLGEAPYRPWCLSEIAGKCRIGEDEAIRATMVLVGEGLVHLTQPPACIEAAAAACHRLNGEILRRALTEDRIHALASAVTGGGVRVSRLEQLFLLALRQGATSPDEWARFAWSAVCRSDNHRDVGASNDPPTATEILKAALYFAQRLPHLVALKLAEGA